MQTVEAPPTERRRWIVVFAAVLLGSQLLLPLHYYLGGGTTDERFAWRMFSSVRMRDGHAAMYETVEQDGGREERQIPPGMLYHWQDLLDQGRLDVARKLMRWYCGKPGIVAVRYELRSKTPDGRDVEPVVWRLDRATGRIETGARVSP